MVVWGPLRNDALRKESRGWGAYNALRLEVAWGRLRA